MMLVHPMQMEQLQLSWEGFPQGLGMRLWEFLNILPEAHLLGQSLTLDEKAWLAVSTVLGT